MAAVTLHLTAADGAVFDLLVQLPTIVSRAQVRVATVVVVPVASKSTWDGTKWLT